VPGGSPGSHASSPPARTAELFGGPRRGLTLGLASTITLVAFESLAIGTVMPIVTGDLGGLELYGWVFSAFFLGNLVGIVVVGGALDRMPIRRPFTIGLGLFAVGLLAGGLAPSMPVLVVARFVQGLGGGAVPPTAYVAIGRGLPESLRPRMFAILSTAWVVPGVIGPTLAAIVGETTSWRVVFLGLLPLLAVAGGLAIRALGAVPDAASPGEEDAARANVRRLPNALLVALGAGVLVAALTASEPAVLVVGSLAGLALLVPAFRRLTPAGTVALAAGLPAAILLRGVLTFGFFSADAYLPLLLQDWRATTAALTGIAFTATTLAWTAGSWLQARRIERVGAPRFVALGFATVGLGTVLTLPVLASAVPPAVSVVTWGIAGLGMGLGYSALSLLVLREADPGTVGSASSALQLSDVLGTALGTGVGGAFIAAAERAGGDALGLGLAATFGMGALVSLAGLVGTRRLVAAGHARTARSAAVD
jgi:MFS family permease